MNPSASDPRLALLRQANPAVSVELRPGVTVEVRPLAAVHAAVGVQLINGIGQTLRGAMADVMELFQLAMQMSLESELKAKARAKAKKAGKAYLEVPDEDHTQELITRVVSVAAVLDASAIESAAMLLNLHCDLDLTDDAVSIDMLATVAAAFFRASMTDQARAAWGNVLRVAEADETGASSDPIASSAA